MPRGSFGVELDCDEGEGDERSEAVGDVVLALGLVL